MQRKNKFKKIYGLTKLEIASSFFKLYMMCLYAFVAASKNISACKSRKVNKTKIYISPDHL